MIFITSENWAVYQGHKIKTECPFSHAIVFAEEIKPILHLITGTSARCGQKQGQRETESFPIKSISLHLKTPH